MLPHQRLHLSQISIVTCQHNAFQTEYILLGTPIQPGADALKPRACLDTEDKPEPAID